MKKTKNKLLIMLGIVAFSAIGSVALTGNTNDASVAVAEIEIPCVHEYVMQCVSPTCTEKGYTVYTCTLCGDGCTDNFVDETGHNFIDVTIEPTCTHKGYTAHFCLDCGYEYKDDYVDAHGHSYEEEAVEPTCTEQGYTTHTCTVCGRFYVDGVVAVNGHDFVEEVTEATCTEGGYTTYTCQTCGYTYQGNTVEPTGHNHQVSVVAPTCVSYGFTVHLCADCGDRYVSDYVKPLGHTFEDTVVEATAESIGYTKHQCAVCDYSYLSDYVTSGDNGYTKLPDEPELPDDPTEESTGTETPVEPEQPDEPSEDTQTHEYLFSPSFDKASKILTITYACECGESYTGAIQLFITDSAGNTAVEIINGNASIDFTERRDDYSVIAVTLSVCSRSATRRTSLLNPSSLTNLPNLWNRTSPNSLRYRSKRIKK